MTKNLKRIFSYILVVTLLSTSIMGCAHQPDLPQSQTEDYSSLATQLIETLTTDIQETTTYELIESTSASDSNSDFTPSAYEIIDTRWEDLVGNIDAAVYGLIINILNLFYESFDASITLGDGTEVFGIGYTDYEDRFLDSDNNIYYVAGFIPLISEPDFEFDNKGNETYEIYNLEHEIDGYGFIYGKDIDPFMTHCVLWGQYIKYGINDQNRITYTCTEYERGNCDESLGTLYSFDENKIVFETDFGNYVPVTGTSLTTILNYENLQNEVNRILQAQNLNYASVDCETIVYTAHEAMNAWFLGHQEEEFMGYKTHQLLEISQNLKEHEIVQFTPDGAIVFDLNTLPPDDPTALTKWLVGGTCIILFVASIATDIIFDGVAVPNVKTLSAAASGLATEVFTQVVIENHAVKNINWAKVQVSISTSIALAYIMPFASGLAAQAGTKVAKVVGQKVSEAVITKLFEYGSNFAISAVTGGVQRALYAYLDGATNEEIVDAAMVGAITAGAFSLLATFLSDAISSGVANALQNNPEGRFATIVKKASDVFAKGKENIQKKLFKDIAKTSKNTNIIQKAFAEDVTYQAKKLTDVEKKAVMKSTAFQEKAINNLPGDANVNFVKTDEFGTTISKDLLRSRDGNCRIRLSDTCNAEIKELFKRKGLEYLEVKNYIVDFSPLAEFKVQYKPTSIRSDNYNNFYNECLKKWKKKPQEIPAPLKKYLPDNSNKLSVATIKDAVSKAKLTPHEGTDGFVYFIDTNVHSKLRHLGGVELAKAMEIISTAVESCSEILHAIPQKIEGLLLAG